MNSAIQAYVKTTETCNLNCSHCFTSGSKGKRIFFNPERTADFFHRLKRDVPKIDTCRFLFHGGEPLLAPIEDMYKFKELTKGIFANQFYSISSNLTLPMTTEIRNFFKDVIDDNFGTSWDFDIRFGSNNIKHQTKQLELWEENSKLLMSDGHQATMMVCITKELIANVEPIEVVNYAHALGFHSILFERITSDGNAKLNSNIIPSNTAVEQWILRMWNQSVESKSYEYIYNMLLGEIATAVVSRTHVGNRCRDCEQSLLTINADGTISGCPNTAPNESWGHIDWRITDSLRSDKRLKAVACEIHRNPLCYKCPVQTICNGDCQKLAWEGDICAAPKSLFIKLKAEMDIGLYNKFIDPSAKIQPH